MSGQQRPAIPVDDLTDKELEVLRLLVSGHTVKSIAVRLGRSEASVNERLRDARRKTGVGSSRELARHLAAQKIWDKKIDLSVPDGVAEEAGQSPGSRRPWIKGTVIMSLTILAAAAALALVVTQPAEQAEAPPAARTTPTGEIPLVGRWSLDLSRIPVEERPRSVILEFRVTDDQEWIGQSDIVAPDGSRQHAETRAAADGTPVPLTGNQQFADMVSLRQPAADTLVLTFTKAGIPVSSRVYTVEADGRTMTETIIWAGDASPRMVTTYFNRVD